MIPNELDPVLQGLAKHLVTVGWTVHHVDVPGTTGNVHVQLERGSLRIDVAHDRGIPEIDIADRSWGSAGFSPDVWAKALGLPPPVDSSLAGQAAWVVASIEAMSGAVASGAVTLDGLRSARWS